MVSVALAPLSVILGLSVSVVRMRSEPPVPGVSTSPALVPVAVRLAFRLIWRLACSVSVLLPAQVTSALTWMSPGSLPVAAVASVMLVDARLVASVSAPMPDVVCAPLPAATVKSVGSMSQWPVATLPRLSTCVWRAMPTCAAEVSTWPPRPLAALTSIWPASARRPETMSPFTVIWPALPVVGAAACKLPLLPTWSPVIQISPPRSTSVLARTMPLLFTSDPAMSWAERAFRVTTPPSAWMRPALSTCPLTRPGVTAAEIRPLPLMLTVAARPEASTTEPASTWMSPWFTTCCPNSARYPPVLAFRLPWLRTLPLPPVLLKT
jgi:hypothetical protein